MAPSDFNPSFPPRGNPFTNPVRGDVEPSSPARPSPLARAEFHPVVPTQILKRSERSFSMQPSSGGLPSFPRPLPPSHGTPGPVNRVVSVPPTNPMRDSQEVPSRSPKSLFFQMVKRS